MAKVENQSAADEAATVDVADAAEESGRLNLNIDIQDVGPCKKHVRISVSRDSIDEVYGTLVQDYSGKAEVPGFRVGHVPADLVKKRFKKELSDQVTQRVLMASLEQLGEDSGIDPINEPNLDLDSIELPEEGDFEFEFDVEVRPEFDLPAYKGLKIERPSREISDADVDAYLDQFLQQYGQLVPVDAPAAKGDFVTVNIESTHNGKSLAKLDEVSIRVRPRLRFRDAEFSGFDTFMTGAKAGDEKSTDIPVSMEAETIEMRGESVHVKFQVLDVKRLETPPLDEEFLSRIGAQSADDLRRQVRGMLERQVKYEQRQACRRQVMSKITDSANWDLPEDLVKKQVENALRRELLEMQQAGFTSKEILARENDLRQRSLTMTRQNLKEHFVLDRIAEEEKVDVDGDDLNAEIAMMALQRGENPRRVRARLVKSGMIENLEAQIRERKAVDIILDNAEFKDVAMPAPVEAEVEALNRSICGSSAVEAPEDEAEESND
ncbi:trigger factor [Planctomicrobium sp. SH664]|uniref:trigger factor n=1 Tax=Planctomicrobium sp. SH664 TaxID=3448125 RepID=UPI003F5B3542